MKIKENIFEELNKMKNLMVAKAGTVISEQANNTATNIDIDTIKQQMQMGFANSDEQKVVDVLKKYTSDKSTFKNFLNQYKSTTGKELVDEIPKQFQPGRDKSEIQDLNNFLSKIGVTFKVELSPDRSKFIAKFDGLDTPAATPETGTRTPEAMKNITNTFCGVRNGKITSGVFKDQPWTSYKTKYSVTDTEEQEAKKSCPTGQRVVQSGPSVSTRFTDSAKSLGIEGGKMDLQTLQTILKSLEGETTTAAATTTQGAPDLTQLTAALNQLQA